jgi:glyoxylate/hydroxypyruvate reductase
MRPILVYKANLERGREWQEILAQDAPEVEFRFWPNAGDPARVEYAVVWEPPPKLIESFPNLKVLFSVAAGVDHLDLASLPAGVPLVRMVEPGITRTMVDYVSFATLALHRDLLDYIGQQREKVWREIRVRPSEERRVGVMGLECSARRCLNGSAQSASGAPAGAGRRSGCRASIASPGMKVSRPSSPSSTFSSASCR